MFCADGKANGILVDSCRFQFSFRKLRVGSCCRVDNKRLDVRYIGKQREYFQPVNKAEGFLLTALDIEGKDRTAAVREIFFIQLMVGVIGQ